MVFSTNEPAISVFFVKVECEPPCHYLATPVMWYSGYFTFSGYGPRKSTLADFIASLLAFAILLTFSFAIALAFAFAFPRLLLLISPIKKFISYTTKRLSLHVLDKWSIHDHTTPTRPGILQAIDIRNPSAEKYLDHEMDIRSV